MVLSSSKLRTCWEQTALGCPSPSSWRNGLSSENCTMAASFLVRPRGRGGRCHRSTRPNTSTDAVEKGGRGKYKLSEVLYWLTLGSCCAWPCAFSTLDVLRSVIRKYVRTYIHRRQRCILCVCIDVRVSLHRYQPPPRTCGHNKDAGKDA